MSPANDLAKMVPGFEFLQNLMKGAGAALPGVQGFGQWVAPTLDPEELDKRIQELKTVQFWLEQNARLLGTTVQALEVQRMTLSTLQTMNLPMADLRNALKARVSAPAPSFAPPPPAAEADEDPVEDEEDDEEVADEEPVAAPPPKARKAAAGKAAPAKAAAPAIDPMQWWGALTQQFTELASKAVKDSAGDAARHLAGAAVKQGVKAAVNTASATVKKAASLPAKAARAAAPRKRTR
jgi:hypothetical protein